MEEEFDEDTNLQGNWSWDYLDSLDTSQYPFPNVLWHVKPAREIAIKTSMMLLVGVFGIFLNFIILLILFRNKWLWSSSNYLIGNLAFIDILTLLFCPWFMLVRDFYQNFVLKNFGCRFEGFLQASLLLGSVCAVMLVSYDRLAAATLAVDARITKKAAPKLIVGSWLLAATVSLPWTFKRDYIERQWLDHLETYCSEDVVIIGVYWHIILTLLVWVPLGLMVVTYAVILWRLEWSSRELSLRGGGQSVKRAKGKAMRITACVLSAAVICRIPYTALIYMRNNLPIAINAVEGNYANMWFAANYLMYMNCAINPLIYGFTNYRFRKAMDRTPGVSCFKFGNWCCIYSSRTKQILPDNKNTEKIFVIEDTPKSNKKLSKVFKNIMNHNKSCLEFTVKMDEITTKPTKVTPLKPDNS
ncbi:hypothetical protein K1T71_009610 [Dendrolimus kikuchii]|uniref:Uncharacterized protein n=1 Tax=Dendrolimus kikuchii TaxID=765133 RepID=A0ACC1CT96_9NEOP|nr:hypothetical protein K1T71_009610 [Dendrolimus kikuchii]